jgi:hypothetical protein
MGTDWWPAEPADASAAGSAARAIDYLCLVGLFVDDEGTGERGGQIGAGQTDQVAAVADGLVVVAV